MESFVDITYHGIELARRVKLTEVAPDAGYLEVPAPMPVGTALLLSIEGGIAINAVVRGVHEQVGGSERPPGMRVAPTLEGEAATRWWSERVTMIAAGAPTSRRTKEMSAVEDVAARAAAERVRVDTGAPPFQDDGRRTRQMKEAEVKAAVMSAAAEEVKLGIAKKVIAMEPTPADGIPAALTDDDGLIDDGKRTEVMAAVDPEILARLTGSGDMPLIDDGRRTIIMDAPPVMDDDSGDDTDDGDDTNGNGNGDDQSPSASGRMPAAKAKGKGKRRKRR